MLPPFDAIAAFAGGALPHTILSCCQGVLLGMFSTRAVLPLRATCRDAATAVAAHPWDDLESTIHGYVGPALLPPGGAKGRVAGLLSAGQGRLRKWEHKQEKIQRTAHPGGGCRFCAFCGPEAAEYEVLRSSH